jgi:hypothetical protein
MVWGEETKPGPQKFPWGVLLISIVILMVLYFLRR